MKLGKFVTISENNGTNLEIFWRRVFCKKAADFKDEVNGDWDSEEEYKRMLMADLDKI